MKLQWKYLPEVLVIIFTIVVGTVILLFIVLNQPSLIDAATLKKLPHKSVSTITTTRLASGLTPPTNKWFSGIALHTQPKTIYPMPLSVSLTDSSFSFGLPTIVTSGDTVTGGMAESITLTINNAVRYQITRYDELSVDITYVNAMNEPIGTLTIVAGSPYVQFSGQQQTSLIATSTLGVPTLYGSKAAYQSSKGHYVVNGSNNATLSGLSTINVTMKAGGLVTMYVAPNATSEKLLDSYASHKIINGNVTYEHQADSEKTTLTITTAHRDGTLYALLPHQSNSTTPLFTYDTLYGKQRMYEGSEFSFTTPEVPVSNELNLGDLNQNDKQLLETTLLNDIRSTIYDAKDSYYAGKQLYRSAQLLQLAHQLNQPSAADNIKDMLRTELQLWFETNSPRSEGYFYFDDHMKSIVGDKPSFGSENGNDHHFHYGYFIYAASILAKYDKDFLKNYGPVVNLLVADIANYKSDEPLPLRRNFDPYFGHSWASGDGGFNDGNNQESSSEAMNAWIAVQLWADQTGNTALRQETAWMLSNEASATKNYWMDIDTSQLPFKNTYTHSLVSLNWSGKREYGTFFSSEPAAKLGIQLLPMSPTQSAISADNDSREAHIKEAIKGSYSLPFGDYILMYNTALAARDRLSIAQQLPDSVIDGANSRTYLYASILSNR